jgi:hypothetical protein
MEHLLAFTGSSIDIRLPVQLFFHTEQPLGKMRVWMDRRRIPALALSRSGSTGVISGSRRLAFSAMQRR